MKIRSISLLLITLAFGSLGCLKDDCNETRTFTRLDPVYISEAELHGDIKVSPGRDLEDPGIIYVYGDYLLINEYQQGVHVLDNSDPSNPSTVAFIEIPGNEHFAVKDDQLQGNRYNALVTIDISEPSQAHEKSRIDNAFQEIYHQEGRGYLAYYRRSNEQQVLDCSDPNFNSVRWSQGGGGGPRVFWQNFDAAESLANSTRGPGTNTVGVGGSTARFTIAADHLYTVTDYQLHVYDLEDACKPRSLGEINLGWGIETIYPFKDKLFIGSSSGMFIYSIDNPAKPLYETSFSHATACDPVVADDETAYVTLRDGNRCQGFVNQLDVIDVSSTTHPKLIKTYRMDNPHGLSILEDFLYICEGRHGLKVFDRSDSKKIDELAHLKNMDARDIIVLDDDHALVSGQDGIYQIDLSNPRKPKELSFIPISTSRIQ